MANHHHTLFETGRYFNNEAQCHVLSQDCRQSNVWLQLDKIKNSLDEEQSRSRQQRCKPIDVYAFRRNSIPKTNQELRRQRAMSMGVFREGSGRRVSDSDENYDENCAHDDDVAVVAIIIVIMNIC